MNILHVCANPKPTEEAISKQLASAFFGKLIELKPEVELINVDLYDEKPPFFSYELYKRVWYPVFNSEYAPNKAEEMSTNYADAQIEKFNDADILVLTMPMWNYSVPAIMKAWIDQVLLPGKTFSISKEEGINGLHKIKRIVLLVSSGAAYKEDDDRDALSRQVRHAFEFVGINEIDVVWAEGQNPMFFDNAEESKSFAIEAAIEAAEDIAEMEI
ncbi:MAG: NAD(P)H-dependent oxidoreductase [Verrucomicrobiota bacterium]|nr:NAD(P)H-dependent oxidoreductase [Verrucomicrobiota bacterium]MEC7908108.1 NAD(P)H-dependent oxidoreductase [Verrucomicrobiota bacterium]MEC8313908.1 NAD(P)H-dependent oxidoreductase [Verrucomicrobiota bacterium]MEC8517216.1 NAD(P)H-dependent oxidoreductase [Verrucomicrobiota bacterium]